MQVDRGFSIDRVLAADLQLSRLRYPDGSDMTRVYGEVLGRLESMPAIRTVGIVQRLRLEGNTFIETLSSMDDTRPILERPVANFRIVSPDYPRAMGIAVTSGRMFTADDRARRPIEISERAARTLWPGEDAIGRLVHRGGGEPFEVVGVVADARIVDLENAAGLVAYVPYWILPRRETTLVVRTETGPLTLVAAVTEAVAAIDPALPIHNLRTMDRVLSDAVAARRFELTLTVGFALAGLARRSGRLRRGGVGGRAPAQRDRGPCGPRRHRLERFRHGARARDAPRSRGCGSRSGRGRGRRPGNGGVALRSGAARLDCARVGDAGRPRRGCCRLPCAGCPGRPYPNGDVAQVRIAAVLCSLSALRSGTRCACDPEPGDGARPSYGRLLLSGFTMNGTLATVEPSADVTRAHRPNDSLPPGEFSVGGWPAGIGGCNRLGTGANDHPLGNQCLDTLQLPIGRGRSAFPCVCLDGR